MDISFTKTIKDLFIKLTSRTAKSERFIGVDIGTSSIKVVELKRVGGRAVLETYGALALGPYAETDIGTLTNLPNEKLAQAVLDTLKESGTMLAPAGLSIPATASLLFVAEIPGSVPESDLATVVPTEARRYIPVPINEVSLDYWMIPRKQEGVYENNTGAKSENQKSEVLVAAIHNDTLAKYGDVVKQSAIDTSFFEIETFSAVRATFSHEMAPVLFVDIGAAKTKLAVIEYGIVRSFHIVNRGSFDMTRALATSLGISFSQAEDLKRMYGLGAGGDPRQAEILKVALDYIFSEVNSAIMEYERKSGKPITRVVFSGGGSLLKEFLTVARPVFNTEVSLGNPFSKVEAPAFLEEVLRVTGPEFTVAVGLALRGLQI